MNPIVIIPTYNEIENIESIIEVIMGLPVAFDLLVVDDNSPDGTAEVVKKMQAKYPNRLFLEQREGKLGLGTAYIHGFQWALAREYEFICEMDADFSHNPNDLVRLYEACAKQGYDLAIGSRYVKGINVVNWSIERILISYFASLYVKFITGLPINDATAGFKCYRRKVLETINLNKIRFIGYAFQIEMKFLTWKFGFKIIEIPIIFTDRTKGKSKMSIAIFREAFFGVFQIKIQSLFQRYIPQDASIAK
ncbi:MAG: polyprenol monophosphomannose synthase [Microscillaceae bacterium]|nr:polyprenol monophosphomannose synthase [Microscillaceae bacterium]MDW8460735.1 polyprenol monophosphomannose synthase [Cytophagales bacterium]